MTFWLLIPMKSFNTGKSRLRAVLDDDTRRALNEFFLCRMLVTARQFPGPATTAVISKCDRVLRAAAGWGVRTIHQRSGAGLNGAAREGIEELTCLGAERIILMACDLPAVQPCDLRELADVGRDKSTIVICPDKHGTGTNALVLPGGTRMVFHFGEGSCARHYREALRAGLVPRLEYNPRIAMDIDTPKDIEMWSSARKVLNGGCGLNEPTTWGQARVLS